MAQRRDPYEILRRWLVVVAVITITVRLFPLSASHGGFEWFYASRTKAELAFWAFCVIGIGGLIVGVCCCWMLRRESGVRESLSLIRNRLSLAAAIMGLTLTSLPDRGIRSEDPFIQGIIMAVFAGGVTFAVLLVAGALVEERGGSREA